MKKIGIISPSNNVLEYFPKRTEIGMENIRELGFETIFVKNAKRENNYSKKSIMERVQEVNELLEQDIDLMIASIGGYLSVQTLPLINYNLIKEKKVTFCGSSDITALLLAIYTKTNQIMLYGPTYTVNLCDYGGIDEYTKKYFLDSYNHKTFRYEPSTYSINEYIDWIELETTQKIKKRISKENDWKVINNGIVEGKLIGGNLSTLLLTLDTEYLPLNLFEKSILFLEDCETNINEFCSFMECLKLKGVFEKINGIIFGKFDTDEMNKNIDKFLKDYFEGKDFPIATNLDFGHVFPCFTLPIGAIANLKCINNKVSLEIVKY